MNEQNHSLNDKNPLRCRRIVAIYGGTFNPVHLGHVQLAHCICNTGIVDEVWFMVSPLNPLKQNAEDRPLPTDIRLRLAEMALKDYDNLNASDFETHLPMPSYTITTLKELHNNYPDCEFKLIVGQDNWKFFHRWVQAQEIKQNHDIIVYGRKDEADSQNHDNKENKAQVTLYKKDGTFLKLSDRFQFKLYDISSTQIRQAIRLHNLQLAAKWLNPDVLRFIMENQLYV